MKTYVGQRPPDDGAACVFVVKEGKEPRPLLHFAYHSPTGFEWGYGGSGPADLALAILADHLGEKPNTGNPQRDRTRAFEMHMAFKWAFVAKFDRAGFTLHADQIQAWLDGKA